MSRDLLECLTEALENPVVDQNGNSAYYISPQVAQWFGEAARRYHSGDVKSLDRALHVLRPRGRPVNPDKSEKIDSSRRCWRTECKARQGRRSLARSSQTDRIRRTNGISERSRPSTNHSSWQGSFTVVGFPDPKSASRGLF